MTVHGTVQGVGFRPFVFGLASKLGLSGFVRNETGTVRIEVEGRGGDLDAFERELELRPPPLARIERIERGPRETVSGPRRAGFQIEESADTGLVAAIAPDIATCGDCLRDLFDPADRRFRHAFVSCTNCGPRLTFVVGTPYDRARTTMSGFPMCGACEVEYHDPRDRRFHAQPIACLACGPRLWLADAKGAPISTPDDSGRDALALAERALAAGGIVAVKGIGGWHLACDARSETAVGALRARKHRDEQPFAILVASIAEAERIAHLSEEERSLLASPAAPIALVRRREGAGIADAVAPRSGLLGVMLASNPVQHLLVRDLGFPLVMTSGNPSGEPIAHDDADALDRLRGIADLFLGNDREIHTRCDDSVARIAAGSVVHVRRSRGWAPVPVALPSMLRTPAIATGGHLKSVFALGEGRRAVASHHLGDLASVSAWEAWNAAVAHFKKLLRLEPERVVHDLHPDYATTMWAKVSGIPAIGVQHHHAHIASCLADNGATGEVIGVAFDGTGWGGDGTIWGGEILVGDAAMMRRAAWLRPVPLPGGEKAVREGWRVAVAHLLEAGAPTAAIEARAGADAVRTVRAMIERGLNTPRSSSIGRLFDAIASIAGIADRSTFEGQAAMRLETLAARAESGPDFTVAFDGSCIDPQPLVREVAGAVARGEPVERIARGFHEWIAAAVAAACCRIRGETGLARVALSGGCFLNAVLLERCTARLAEEGFDVLRHRSVPPNDAGLWLGQLAIVAARDSRNQRKEA